MPRPKPMHGNTKVQRLEQLLRDLQAHSESTGSEVERRDRRLILRGLRVAAWTLFAGLTTHEISQEFHDELFRANPPTQRGVK